MALDLNSLVSILDKHLYVYRQLLTVSRQEQVAIVNNKPTEIDDCVHKKDQLLGILEKLEKAKQKTLATFAVEMQINKKIVSVSEIIDHLHGKYKEKIKQYIKDLTNIILELKVVNQNNGKLLNYSLHFIHHMISNFTSVNEVKCTYTASGIYQKPNRVSNVEYCF